MPERKERKLTAELEPMALRVLYMHVNGATEGTREERHDKQSGERHPCDRVGAGRCHSVCCLHLKSAPGWSRCSREEMPTHVRLCSIPTPIHVRDNRVKCPGNGAITLDSSRCDEARGRCSVEIRMVRDGESITAAGWYDDRYRRVEGKWKFAARIFHAFHMVPLSKGWA